MPKMTAASPEKVRQFNNAVRSAARRCDPKTDSIRGLARLVQLKEFNQIEEMAHAALVNGNASFFQNLYLAMSGKLPKREKRDRDIIQLAIDAWYWFADEGQKPTWKNIRAWVDEQRGSKMAYSRWKIIKKDPALIALMNL